jgi:hypothetical protein
VRAFANGDHGAAAHSPFEQCSQSGSVRMTVTVWPQVRHRYEPVAVAPLATRVSATVCWTTATTIDPFRRA